MKYLQTFRTLCVSKTLCELRKDTCQERINSHALLSIERELTDGLNFDGVIAEFASLKARKVWLQDNLMAILLSDQQLAYPCLRGGSGGTFSQ